MRFAVLLFAALLLAGCEPAVEWREFVSPDGAFRVEFPGAVILPSATEPGAQKLYRYQGPERATHFSVTCFDYPANFAGVPSDEAGAADLFDELTAKLVNARNATVSETTPLKLGPHFGREIAFTSASGNASETYHWRFYLVDRRLYQLGVGGREAVNAATRRHFFESFQLNAK